MRSVRRVVIGASVARLRRGGSPLAGPQRPVWRGPRAALLLVLPALSQSRRPTTPRTGRSGATPETCCSRRGGRQIAFTPMGIAGLRARRLDPDQAIRLAGAGEGPELEGSAAPRSRGRTFRAGDRPMDGPWSSCWSAWAPASTERSPGSEPSATTIQRRHPPARIPSAPRPAPPCRPSREDFLRAEPSRSDGPAPASGERGTGARRPAPPRRSGAPRADSSERPPLWSGCARAPVRAPRLPHQGRWPGRRSDPRAPDPRLLVLVVRADAFDDPAQRANVDANLAHVLARPEAAAYRWSTPEEAVRLLGVP